MSKQKRQQKQMDAYSPGTTLHLNKIVDGLSTDTKMTNINNK